MTHSGSLICRDTWLPLGLTWLAFALRVSGLTAQSLWRDEVDALRFATQAFSALSEMFRRAGENGPLFFLGLRPWLQVAGDSEFALRFPSAAAGALAVPIIYALVARLTRERTGAALAALLMATAPYAVWYGQEAKMYAALMVLVPLSFYLALQASWRGGWWRWALLYLVTSLGFYTHLLAALALPAQIVWLLVLPSLAPGPERERAGRDRLTALAGLRPSPSLWPVCDRASSRAGRRRLAALGYLALLILPYLPLARWQAPMLLAGDVQTGYPFVSLPTLMMVMLVAFSRGILPVTEPITVLPWALALLGGIALWAVMPQQFQIGRTTGDSIPWLNLRRHLSGSTPAPEGASQFQTGVCNPRTRSHSEFLVRPTAEGSRSRRRRWGTVALLLVWYLVPQLGIYAVSLRRPLFADRYLIWTLPAFLALAALGVTALARAWRPLGGIVLAGLVALNLAAAWSQVAQPIKSDFRAAARFVIAHQEPGDLLLFQIPYNRYTFTYYSGELDRWLEGPYTNNGMSEAELDADLAYATAGVKAVWFIDSEAEMWDKRDLTEAWLDTHGTTSAHAEFTRVAVTRYELH